MALPRRIGGQDIALGIAVLEFRRGVVGIAPGDSDRIVPQFLLELGKDAIISLRSHFENEPRLPVIAVFHTLGLDTVAVSIDRPGTWPRESANAKIDVAFAKEKPAPVTRRVRRRGCALIEGFGQQHKRILDQVLQMIVAVGNPTGTACIRPARDRLAGCETGRWRYSRGGPSA